MTTEYTTSPAAVYEYMSARDRTAYWVRAHSATETEFYSPSLPPSELQGYAPPPPPSESGSSHSIPPKMILRYDDGRPDRPIPHPDAYAMSTRKASRHHSHMYSHYYYSRRRAGSHGSSTSSDSPNLFHHHRPASPSRAPEEIRILPSQGAPSNTSYHSRSRSLPRVYDGSSGTSSSVSSPQAPRIHSKPMHSAYNSHSFPGEPAILNHVHSGKPSHTPRNASKHNPPAIYAPSHHHSHLQYAHPGVYSHPHQVAPNGIRYSHSAPVPSTYYSTAGVPQVSSHDPTTPYDNRRMRGAHHKLEQEIIRPHSAAGHHSRPRKRHESGVSYKSQASGDTYYVVPGSPAGHKAQSNNPSAGHSVVTATSTTKSHSSSKKPFFQRLISKLSSSGSTKASTVDSKVRLQRRHSTTGAARRPVVPLSR